jgi:hypothetical protein
VGTLRRLRAPTSHALPQLGPRLSDDALVSAAVKTQKMFIGFHRLFPDGPFAPTVDGHAPWAPRGTIIRVQDATEWSTSHPYPFYPHDFPKSVLFLP